ncbi:undecaprenyl-phosphate glucose phosphotransferase [Desulfomicrobium escambiense]|uniref:undecaprenyl-phosphate glucose phosphotransferase n=1 Tax=Desulfomicrobium escambiense TaxID=29503 RepID=UPI00041BEA4A|nr:undecaprenyl-phosphate glucose phosphotransferase [Desulfomicrobium escambiense]
MTNFSSKISTTTRIAEILVITGSMLFVYVIYPMGDAAHLTIATLLGTIIYSFAAELTGANADLRLRPFFIEARRVLGAWILTFLCLIVISWATKHTSTFSRLQIGMWAALGAGMLVAARGSIRNLLALYRRQGRNQRQAVLIGAGSLAQQWIQTVRNYPELGIVPVAAYDDDPVKIGGECKGVPVLGDCGHAVTFVNEKHVPMVFLTLPHNAEKRARQILDQFLSSPANLYIIPDIFTFQLMNLNAFQVGDIPVIALSASPMSARKEILKRAEDLILGILALIVASPVMLGITLAIKLTSPGPVFFRQWRYGLDGREIRIWKFRTMCVTEDGYRFQQATRDDWRITPLGRLLRRFSLDELPQLFNVLDGSMSLVGPRPHAVAHDESFRSRLPGYMWRLKIKPGITGWAQVNGWRGETDTMEKMEKRVEHDHYYIENWTLSLDIRILWLTLLHGFVNDNA